MLKFFIVTTPLVALALWVLVRALSGRPLSRYALNVVVALFLLGYLLVTAGLGVFWVARMDLPVFDWHYLFGYAVVLLVTVHVALQLPVLAAYSRRALGRARPHGRSRGARRALSLAGILGMVGLAAWWLGGRRRAPAALRPAPAASGRGGPAVPVEPVVEREGRIVDIASYLYEESSYSRAGVLRSVGLSPPRPADVKPYPDLPRVALRPPRESGESSLTEAFVASAPVRGTRVPPSSLSLEELSDLTFHAAGVTFRGETSGIPLRAAASSGALYPTDLYVLARSVEGLAPDAYYYDPDAHALVRLRRAGALAVLSPELPWAFVLAATYDRTVSKYNVRSCRYLPLDAGHVAGNLVLAGHGLGRSLAADTWFDDAELGRALGLDSKDEAPLLVLHDGAPEARRPPRRPARLPSDLAQGELTRLAQKLTSWELDRADRANAELVAPATPDLVRGAATRALGKGQLPQQDVLAVIRSRRSFRAFARSAARGEDVAGVLSPATSLLSNVRGGAIVEAFVIVRAVEGLEPGAYRFAPGDAALEPLRTGDFSWQIERAGLDQELLGRAAFVVAWSLSPERLGRLDGARDFRSACLAAGVGGQATYLAATARGLGVCGVGAFYDGEVNALLGPHARVIYLMGVGVKV